MPSNKLRNPYEVMRDLDAIVNQQNESVRQHSEEFREQLANDARKFGRTGCRTPEQQAAWDAFVASAPVTFGEILTEKDWEDWLVEAYMEHGCIPALMPVGDVRVYDSIDWDYIRRLAMVRLRDGFKTRAGL